MDDLDFIKSVYDDLHQRFNSESRCWKNYYWKNYLIFGETIFKLEGECLPCHIQNNLFRSYLVESGRFSSSQLITRTTICIEVPMFHTYTEVHLDNGTIVNVDIWGSHWNVPFGKTIHDTEVCEKD